eukprot:IDg11072t1
MCGSFGLGLTPRGALSRSVGIVHIFDMMQMKPRPITVHPSDVFRNSADNYVRQCAFSDDGCFLVSVDDATNVMQYERVTKEKGRSAGTKRRRLRCHRRCHHRCHHRCPLRRNR